MPEREHIYARNAAGQVKRMLRSSLYHKDGWEECDAPPPPKPRPPREPKKRAPRVSELPAQHRARKRAETKEQ